MKTEDKEPIFPEDELVTEGEPASLGIFILIAFLFVIIILFVI